MCVTPVVKCWHCGEWFIKKGSRESFEPCPNCGKGFEELTAEAKQAVLATLAPFFEVPRLKEKPLEA